jgi:hypothetical protein
MALTFVNPKRLPEWPGILTDHEDTGIQRQGLAGFYRLYTKLARQSAATDLIELLIIGLRILAVLTTLQN